MYTLLFYCHYHSHIQECQVHNGGVTMFFRNSFLADQVSVLHLRHHSLAMKMNETHSLLPGSAIIYLAPYLLRFFPVQDLLVVAILPPL